MTKCIFISADHGMAIIYFLQSDLVLSLLEAGVEVLVLTDDDTKDKIAAKFSALSREPKGRLTFEGLRLKQANQYANTVQPRFTPGLYTDSLDKHQPDLVIVSTATYCTKP